MSYDEQGTTSASEPDEGLLAAFARWYRITADTPRDQIPAQYKEAESMGFSPRLSRYELPTWLRVPLTGRVFLCWQNDWREGAVDLVWDVGELQWDVPRGVKPGDAIISVLGCQPPLVAALEQVTVVDGEDIEVDRFIVDRPVSWNDIADYLGTKPAQRSHQLARGSEIFAEVRGRIEYTSRALTPLTPGDHHNSAVWTAALLRQKSDQLLCAACNEPMHPADAITNPSLSWDAQFYEGDKPTSCDLGAAGDAVALVCPACDHVLHGPATFEDLARRLRPACPSCLLRENVAPLRSEGTSEASEGHVCQVRSSASRRAQWHCAACSRDFRVSDAAGALPGNRAEVPPRRQRDRGLYTAEGIARALGRNLEPGDEVPRAIGNLLTGYADWDVWVEDTPEEELEIGIGNIGVGLDYPVTLDRLFSAVDDLSELASEQAEAQLNEGD